MNFEPRRIFRILLFSIIGSLCGVYIVQKLTEVEPQSYSISEIYDGETDITAPLEVGSTFVITEDEVAFIRPSGELRFPIVYVNERNEDVTEYVIKGNNGALDIITVAPVGIRMNSSCYYLYITFD